MRATAEVRWFYSGAIPDPVASWFDTFDPTSEEPRTDLYLRPTDDALNVKLREGHSEAKRRDAEGEVVAIAKGISGRVERWRKWSLPLAEDAEHPQDDHWLSVRKARRKLSYSIDEYGHFASVPIDTMLYGGCEVELSRIEVAGVVWWSICFEAFGVEERLRDLLLQTTAHVFAQGMPPALDAEHSCGYAAWLRRV